MIGIYRTDTKEIYFELFDHDLVSGTKLRETMKIMIGYEDHYFTDGEVREFARIRCKGIRGEIKYPSVTKLLEYGHKTTAIFLYYKETPNVSLLEARDHINNLMEYMKDKL